MLTEAGISNFPEDIGFLFHKQSVSDIDGGWAFPLKRACDFFGTDVVVNMVNHINSSIDAGRFERMHVIEIAAVANPNIVADGLYFVCGQDPISWIPSPSTEDSFTST